MKIIILGAGQVGSSVLASLASEANDIVMVDTQPALLKDLQDRFDIGTVQGNAAHPTVLKRAGADEADMLIAVTSDDETNMLACQMADILFKIPRKIARVRAIEYFSYPGIFSPETIPIDVVISPEQIITQFIERLLKYPGASQVLDFAEGRVRLVSVRAHQGGPLVGREIRELHQHMPNVHARITAIFRNGLPVIPNGKTIIQADDEVFFAASSEEIKAVMSELRELERPYKRLMFAGGGHIGKRVAQALEGRYQVKLVEKDYKRAQKIAADLSNTVVLAGDASDKELLLSENIENTDIFCAITNDDEANILSAMLAKRLGARRVISLVNKSAYADLVDSSLVDLVLSPQQATISALLRYVRRGDIVQVHSLRHGASEAIEAVAHGRRGSSKVVGIPIDKINIPPGVVMGALVRGDEVIQVHHDTVIEEGDHVIMFLLDKKLIPMVEQIFQATDVPV
ncbi:MULTISPECIES: Trk system potassium transporter TrkA [Methylocaldum]|jgi:trk system potassium uptake protein TrkA|uniref:Trk system potassium transporter TrkA n=1 Tax=unclassified Methylocaldum TaxID=2622260 RepID=UPI000989D8F2|nr:MULTISPECIES: Trk system potassium transporter TrkA [unclassified Methylocaldum]MBP1150150.1 trk system potassium uptake protein TrkA [Methylocaldum sp. RMAD-M]MVF24050.1 Trk system potassium transporter TrkA [Methylocaldum sp. BRCS4]